MVTNQAIEVTYEGPLTLVGPDRRHRRIGFILHANERIPSGTRFQLVMGRYRSLRDNNPQIRDQWREFEATIEGTGAVETLAGAPETHVQMREARLGPDELFNHYRIGLVDVTQALEPGSELRLTCEALLTHQAPVTARVLVQTCGPDGEAFSQVGEVVDLQGIPGEVCRIEARVKSAVNDEGDHPIRVYGLDEVWNPAEVPVPPDQLETEVIGPGEFNDGAVHLLSDEPVRLRVRDRRRGFESLSNPVRRKAFNGYRVYFGGIHFHTRYSADGDRELEQAYEYARDTLGLDFAGVTDHAPAPFWEHIQAINERFNAAGSFVTLPSWEWSTSTGHSNIYLRTPDVPEGPAHNKTAKHPGQAEWSDQTIVVPHHTNIRSDARKADGSHYWHEFNWSLPNRRVRLIELLQTRGNFEADRLDGDWGIVTSDIGASVRDALAMGFRIGFVGGTDNHTGFPTRDPEMGRGHGGMACVLAEQLSRESIWQAMDARRTYATSGKPILCHWTVNGHEMGEEGLLGDDRVSFCADLHGTAPIERIEVISNGRTVWRCHPDAFDVTLTHEHLPEPEDDGAYYYLRLRQHDGHRAWLSPVWLDRR